METIENYVLIKCGRPTKNNRIYNQDSIRSIKNILEDQVEKKILNVFFKSDDSLQTDPANAVGLVKKVDIINNDLYIDLDIIDNEKSKELLSKYSKDNLYFVPFGSGYFKPDSDEHIIIDKYQFICIAVSSKPLYAED